MRLNAKRTALTLVTAILPFCLALSAMALPAPDTTKAAAPAKPKPAATAGKSAGTKKSGTKSSAAKKSGVIVFPSDSLAAHPPGKIHTLDEIVEIIKNSNLYYSVETLVVVPHNAYMGDMTRPVLSADRHIVKVNHVPSLVKYKLSSMGIPLLGMASGAFGDKDYPAAVAGYKRLLVSDPSFDLAYSYLGESYLMQDSLDSARVYLDTAIARNYIDFSAHRLLSEVLWKSGDQEGGIKELTIAHVLNINDSTMRAQLEEWREKAGRGWGSQTFMPRYQAHRVADTVYVKATMDWIGYAMVKAVWQYEPGYAKKQLGYDPTGSVYIMMAEKEGIVGALSTNREAAFINPIVTQGYLEEFILYEIVGPRYPMNIVTLPKTVIERIAEYVNKFH
jgi:tetratricopeptide (TPR) repeat protein